MHTAASVRRPPGALPVSRALCTPVPQTAHWNRPGRTPGGRVRDEDLRGAVSAPEAGVGGAHPLLLSWCALAPAGRVAAPAPLPPLQMPLQAGGSRIEQEPGPRSLLMAMGFIPQLPTGQGHCLHQPGLLLPLITARPCSHLSKGYTAHLGLPGSMAGRPRPCSAPAPAPPLPPAPCPWETEAGCSERCAQTMPSSCKCPPQGSLRRPHRGDDH